MPWVDRRRRPRRDERSRAVVTAPRRYDSGGGVERIGERGDEAIDLGLLGDERRRELDRVAAVANVEALVEALHRDLVRAFCGLAGDGVDREAGGETEVANVRDVLAALERVDLRLEVR